MNRLSVAACGRLRLDAPQAATLNGPGPSCVEQNLTATSSNLTHFNAFIHLNIDLQSGCAHFA